MPELLRIQPQAPNLDPGQVHVPTLGGAYFGRGLDVLGETFQKIQDASDDAELRALTATGRNRMDATVKTANMEFSNPDDFTTNARDRLKETHDALLGSASNARVRGALKTGLQDELIKFNYQIDHDANGKRIDIAKGNSEIFMEDAQRRLMGAADPTERTKVEQEIVDHMRLMQRTGAIKPVDAVKKMQKIAEDDAYNRAFFVIRDATDPIAAFEKFQQENPNLDPNRLRILVDRADAEQVKRTKELEKAAKQIKEDAVLDASIKATNGQMTLPELDQLARNQRFSAAEYKQVQTAMESGGVTNTATFNAFEQDIREGKITDYRRIMASPGLDRVAKSQLMALITARKDHYVDVGFRQRAEDRAISNHAEAHHFSHSPAYQEAVKEYRATISAKGPMESLSDKEQRQYTWGLQQMWDRVSGGENPMAVGREISERARQMKSDGLFADDPVATPRFQSKDELIEKYKTGKITRQQFDSEALLFEQHDKTKAAEEKRKAANPQGANRARR